MRVRTTALRLRPLLILAVAALALITAAPPMEAQTCFRFFEADVVAFDQVFFWNRLGAVQPQGMMYALRRDVEPISGTDLSPGNVKLREDKRPRPIVLRMTAGECIRIQFQNLLAPTRVDDQQPATRHASIHAVGMQLVNSMQDDGSYVGSNATNGIVPPGGSITYTLYAEREGQHLIYSAGATNGGEGDGGSTPAGLFGAIVVEPAGARWYRSQVTREDLELAATGITAEGQPIVNYEARYPAGHPRAGTPILNMLDGDEIVHTDLTAIVAGSPPNEGGLRAGWFPEGTFPPNPTYPQRDQPFREFTIIYHDEIGAVQAFPVFNDNVLSHTLHSGRDAFAINYGTGGIGAEIFANRIEVGPMHDCTECKYEEFFLTSWAVGDPAMVVDVPANAPCTISQIQAGGGCTPTPGPKATKAFYPDDPSNVYHGYLNDHTRFRVLHAGPKEHHIHHLHAHQWLFSADSDESTYLDSQALGPGSSFTTEIAYHGAGNQNRTPGDSIFHCHFYPHFAQGMWSLWRVHDVFELGTILDEGGRPATGVNRALPDGEIAQGTPIPALVPLPGIPMAPMPTADVAIVNGQAQVSNLQGSAANPGFPFYIPGVAGHRPPHPPRDTVDDGGLPRHVASGGTFVEAHTRLDWHKELRTLVATQLPENGTLIEVYASVFHSQFHNSCLPDGSCGELFWTNGRGPQAGAPLADPCPSTTDRARLYKGADIQADVKLNKVGWHFPQQRFSALWEDVDDFLDLGGTGTKKAPEPLFFRANSGECIEYQLTNLVPNEYNLDDFQVRTPTDILGQHIHLVKFDVLASDGAANGFNYEDGSFSPEEVRERIDAIRASNGCAPADPRNGTFACPEAEVHPFFGPGPDEDGDNVPDWLGAQTTVQRWYADPILNNEGEDRTLRTVFTHDHFGPSTHQQAGLYAGLVVEPAGSTWFHNETGAQLGIGRSDGGPTSWQAVIDVPAPEPDHREFLLEFQDFQLAYQADSQPCRFDATLGAFRCDDPDDAINPPGRKEIGLPDFYQRPVNCPTLDGTTGPAAPCPELISADDVGTMSMNYRNEPVALRVFDPATGGQAAGWAGDLSMIFSSRVTRALAALNTQPGFYPPLTQDVLAKDPYTPLLRAYENDRVQIRILVGAHEEGHNFSVHGIKWLFEPSEPNSGYRNSQVMGISEHFEFIVPQLVKQPSGSAVDRLWSAGSSTDDYWNGIWGLFRAYTGLRPDLEPLPDNPNGQFPVNPAERSAFDFSCPKDAPERVFDVSAIVAWSSLVNQNRRITYNNRVDGAFGRLFDPTGMMFIRDSDLDLSTAVAKPLPGTPIEPLVLRARAGECIVVNLTNRIGDRVHLQGFNALPMLIEGFNANDLTPSYFVGLHPQLLYYDVSRYDGIPIGNNGAPDSQIVNRGQTIQYRWYAGDVQVNPDGTVTKVPIEFGATNLLSSDRMLHASKGGFGALIIEPADATWTEDTATRAAARVQSVLAGNFREFVTQFQNDVNLRIEDANGETVGGVPVGRPVQVLGGLGDPEDSGQKAINYRTEPLWKRMQHAPQTDFSLTDNFTDWWDVVHNSKVLFQDPQTPVFTVEVGEATRFRLLQAGGHSRNIVFALHGHAWDKEPYVDNSTELGHNAFSFIEGARMGHGATNHFDVLLRNGAGGAHRVTGDYLFRDQVSTGFDNGLWGILRVRP